MVHTHQRSRGTILQYARQYLGEGKYWIRGICKGIQVADEWISVLDPKTTLQVVTVDLVKDSLGKWNNPEDGKNSLFEGTFYDPNFIEHGSGYEVLRQYK